MIDLDRSINVKSLVKLDHNVYWILLTLLIYEGANVQEHATLKSTTKRSTTEYTDYLIENYYKNRKILTEHNWSYRTKVMFTLSDMVIEAETLFGLRVQSAVVALEQCRPVPS